jgi:endonuclease YncB( thermonuclease family)
MTGIVIKAIIGLFVWLVLPNLFFKKGKKKKSPYRKFTLIVCTVIGVLILIYAGVDLIQMLFSNLRATNINLNNHSNDGRLLSLIYLFSREKMDILTSNENQIRKYGNIQKRKNTNKSALFSIIICLLMAISCHSNNTKQNYITGKVVKILDGDTYDLLLDDETTVRIRMDGIDAPEKGMPFSKKARTYLGELCKEQTIDVEKTGEDQHGRILGLSYLEDGRELGAEMLKSGLAWHYKKYNSDFKLAALENEARQAKRGLWKDPNPMPPWENRKLHRQGISTKDTFEIKEGEE